MLSILYVRMRFATRRRAKINALSVSRGCLHLLPAAQNETDYL